MKWPRDWRHAVAGVVRTTLVKHSVVLSNARPVGGMMSGKRRERDRPMATSPVRGVRVPDELVRQARTANPELADFDLSRLLRVGLALVAGHPRPKAIEISRGGPRGPKPGFKAGTAA